MLVMNIDGRQFEAQITEPIDQVLQAMGLNQRASHKVDQIKAPMPGMVLSILVTEGQELGKGDPVLVLEAMKMENVFKAPADALVKEIRVKEKTAVEKGQVLVIFE
jgi:biotin carboxyl carrier protein